MTRLLFINPNSTHSMTEAVLASARTAAPRAEITGWTSDDGPPAIQGPEDGDAASPPLLKLIGSAVGANAIIIACFDDTALAQAKKSAKCPVIGIGEAAYHLAALRGHRFSVITTLAVSVPVIEANIAAMGLAHLCGKVRASNIPVLELERAPDAAFETLTKEAQAALREDNIDTILLGCSGMTELTHYMRQTLDVPIIDGVEAATHLGLALAELGQSQ